MDSISKPQAMMIVARQMRVLPRNIKENRLEWFEKYLHNGFDMHRLASALYEDFYGTPYCQPEFISQVSHADVKNRKRFGVIFRGVRGYMEASEPDRAAFRRNAEAKAGLAAMARYYWCIRRYDLERC